MEPVSRDIAFVSRLALLAAGLLLAASALRAGPSQTEFGDPASPMYVAWAGREIRVWVMPQPNEGYRQIARRVMADPGGYAEIERYHGGRPVMLGHPVSFPLADLKPDIRSEALRALHPADYATETAWVHPVTYPSENLITLAEAYTGSRGRYAELAGVNRLRNPDLLRIGTEIVIPQDWIPDELSLRPEGVKPPLTYERDPKTRRRYAVYVLRKDETLYSSVILRFTDREFAEEVNRMAVQLARLNGLSGPERVPAGKRLRIPLEWISEDYLLPRGAKDRVARAEPAPAKPPRLRAPAPAPRRVPPPPRRPGSKGGPAGSAELHVIIDPGHGGVDAGATYGSRRGGDLTYEDEVVYDIALRLGNRLEAMGHRVHFTIADPNQTRPLERLPTRREADEVVLVTPPYRIDDVDAGVNLRVYRIESLYRSLLAGGATPDEVLLVSIHGDALAPSLRGAMVYYPDPNLRSGEFRPRGRIYRLRKEAVPALIRYSPEANVEAADLSQDLAEAIIVGLKSHGVLVGGRKPVRSFYYRNDRRTLPAVLRYSRVPSSVLVEVANLNNPQDRRLLLRGSARERIARGLAAALDEHAARLNRLSAQAAAR